MCMKMCRKCKYKYVLICKVYSRYIDFWCKRQVYRPPAPSKNVTSNVWYAQYSIYYWAMHYTLKEHLILYMLLDVLFCSSSEILTVYDSVAKTIGHIDLSSCWMQLLKITCELCFDQVFCIFEVFFHLIPWSLSFTAVGCSLLILSWSGSTSWQKISSTTRAAS